MINRHRSLMMIFHGFSHFNVVVFAGSLLPFQKITNIWSLIGVNINCTI